MSEPTSCCIALGGYCEGCDLLVGLDSLRAVAVERDDRGRLRGRWSRRATRWVDFRPEPVEEVWPRPRDDTVLMGQQHLLVETEVVLEDRRDDALDCRAARAMDVGDIDRSGLQLELCAELFGQPIHELDRGHLMGVSPPRPKRSGVSVRGRLASSCAPRTAERSPALPRSRRRRWDSSGVHRGR
jgi:hypothetical protein